VADLTTSRGLSKQRYGSNTKAMREVCSGRVPISRMRKLDIPGSKVVAIL